MRRESPRIVATGTQSRSAPGTREFVADVHAGIYGPVKVARGLCYKPRKSIGKVTGPQKPPAELDYNLHSSPFPEPSVPNPPDPRNEITPHSPRPLPSDPPHRRAARSEVLMARGG